MNHQLQKQPIGSLTVEEARHTIGSFKTLPTLGLCSKRSAQIRANELKTILSDLSHPCDDQWLWKRVATLLGHYYAAVQRDEIGKSIALDWLKILSGYPRWALDQACTDYLACEDSHKRPTPGRIITLAVSRMAAMSQIESKIREAEELVKRCDVLGSTPESKARVQALVDGFVRGSKP